MYHENVYYSDLKNDDSSLVFCGESYSYNFVDRSIQGYMISLNANSGMPKWGKQYQTTDGSLYIGLFEICKYTPT